MYFNVVFDLNTKLEKEMEMSSEKEKEKIRTMEMVREMLKVKGDGYLGGVGELR
jgi:hypothetical protein